MPRPLSVFRITGAVPETLVERTGERALEQKGDEVPSRAPHGLNDFGDRDRLGPDQRDGGAQLARGDGRDPVGHPLLEADHAAGNVPAEIQLVVTPRQQRLAPLVADEQIDVDHRREPGEQLEDVLRQPAAGVADGRLDRGDVILEAHRHFVSSPDSRQIATASVGSKSARRVRATSSEYPAATTMTASTGSVRSAEGGTIGRCVAGVNLPCLNGAESTT